MMKKILFLFIAFTALQMSAQTEGKAKIQQLFEVNGKADHYKSIMATNTDKFLNELAPIYTKYLSEDDIQTMIDFYSSEEGKKVVSGDVPRAAETGMPGYDKFMTSTAYKKYLKNAREIAIQELALKDKYLGTK